MNRKFLLFILCCLVGISACKDTKKDSSNLEKSIVVQVQTATKTATNGSISVSGNVEGNKTVRLGFMVAGRINSITIEEGQSIQSGKLLSSLDPENYSIAKEIADATLDQTQDEYNRLKQMYERKSLSESDFSKITNGLRQAKAQQKLQAKNLTETKLYSPISGILLKKGAEVGEIIGVGLPLFVISDISTVKVNASVPESEMNQMHIGNTTKIYISALNDTVTGKIVEIGSVAEATTRAFAVKIEVKNPKLLIRPGMTAEIAIESAKKAELLTLPANCILHDVDNSAYVYVVDTQANKSIKRKVSIGKIVGENIEVLSGISPEDKVIVSGQNKVSNGSNITLK